MEHHRPETLADALLVFGGDGTVHRALAAAVQTQVPVLAVPVGSGNDFARALGINDRYTALAAWQKFCAGGANLRQIDLGCIQAAPAGSSGNWKLEAGNCFFCCVAGVGIDSEANRRANAMPAWLRAHGGYVLGMVRALFSFQPRRISVEQLDGQSGETLTRISEPAMMVALANAPSYGRGMRIAPRAKLDDAHLDICFVRQTSQLRLLRLFPKVFSGGHLGLPEIFYSQARRVYVETEVPLEVYADGEFICRTPIEITVAPKALRVIVAEPPQC